MDYLINAQIDRQRNAANALLLKGTSEGNITEVQEALEKGANPNYAPIFGDAVAGGNPLHDACALGRRDIAEELLNAKAYVNARDNYSQTPLHRAAASGNAELIRLLVQAGADINARDNKDRLPVHVAIGDDLSGLVRNTDVVTALAMAHPTMSQNANLIELLNKAPKQQGHAGRITGERKDKNPPQVGG